MAIRKVFSQCRLINDKPDRGSHLISLFHFCVFPQCDFSLQVQPPRNCKRLRCLRSSRIFLSFSVELLVRISSQKITRFEIAVSRTSQTHPEMVAVNRRKKEDVHPSSNMHRIYRMHKFFQSKSKVLHRNRSQNSPQLLVVGIGCIQLLLCALQVGISGTELLTLAASGGEKRWVSVMSSTRTRKVTYHCAVIVSHYHCTVTSHIYNSIW